MGQIPYIVYDEMHLQTFNAKALKSLLNPAGFDVLQVKGIRNRFKFLLKISTILFSETLIVVAKKNRIIEFSKGS